MPPDALQRMRIQLEQWEQASDPRAVFLGCYCMMTANLMGAIEAGEFQDPEWVGHLMEHFAEYYFVALQAYERNQPHTPATWRLAFDRALQPGGLALQNLLLGVNAHINYDLVLALSDLLESDWENLDEPARRRRYEDHCQVNRVIARTIDSVQDAILEPHNLPMQLVDVLFGPVDEWLVSQLIESWRDQVWEQVTLRLACAGADAREEQRRAVESGCLKVSDRILLRGL